MPAALYCTDLLPAWSEALLDKDLLASPSLLPETPARQAEQEREAFDASRSVGLRWRADHTALTASELAFTLQASGLPCIDGRWQAVPDQPGVQVLRRPACQIRNPGYCNRWREALDGLVMGAGDSLRYSRHSHGCDPFGAEECVDVLYDLTDAARWRWAPVPAQLKLRLQPLQHQLGKTRAGLTLHGYAEGQLFAQIDDQHPQLGGHRYGLLLESIQRFMAREMPEIVLREMSPQAVWTGD